MDILRNRVIDLLQTRSSGGQWQNDVAEDSHILCQQETIKKEEWLWRRKVEKAGWKSYVGSCL